MPIPTLAINPVIVGLTEICGAELYPLPRLAIVKVTIPSVALTVPVLTPILGAPTVSLGGVVYPLPRLEITKSSAMEKELCVAVAVGHQCGSSNYCEITTVAGGKFFGQPNLRVKSDVCV